MPNYISYQEIKVINIFTESIDLDVASGWTEPLTFDDHQEEKENLNNVVLENLESSFVEYVANVEKTLSSKTSSIAAYNTASNLILSSKENCNNLGSKKESIKIMSPNLIIIMTFRINQTT